MAMPKEIIRTGKALFSIGILALLALLQSTQTEGVSWSEPPAISDEEIVDLVKKAGSKEDHPDDHVIVVTHRTDVTVENTGLSHIVERRVVKILDAEGVKDGSVTRFDYDPATQVVDLRWAKIFKADGRVIELDPGKARDLPQPLSGIFWPVRMKLLEAPGLEPGDAVACETYKKGFQIAYLLNPAGEGGEDKYIPPMKGHYYDVFLFEETLPVKEKKYEIHMLRSKPFHWEIYNGTAAAKHSFDDKMDHYAWWKKDMAAVPDEKRQPDRSDFVTKLVLATVKDWEEKSVWFFEINEPVFAANDAIKKKVAEITAAGKTDKEKVKLLLRWVAHNIRYSGITMGKGEGYTLHPGTMTFDDRCGVCKDIAGMLVTMMRAAGYEVYPAMTMAGARVEDLPADQFNHCVVAWKKKNGQYEMLDPTWMPFDVATWSYAEGAQDYLIGTKQGEDLKQTPPYKPEDNKFIISGQSSIDGGGNLSGKLALKATGYADTRMRRAFAYQAAKENRAFYEGLLASISPLIKIDKFERGDWHDLGSQFYVAANYRVSGYAAAGKAQMRLTVPLAHPILRQERWSPYLMLAPWKERKNPAIFWFPQLVTVYETVKLPPGFAEKSLPGDKTYDGDFVAYSFSMKREGASLVYKAWWKIKGRIALKENFEELDKLAAAIDEMDRKEILIEAGGKKGGGK
jgi:transglutaminase-like putative cysteine protease